MSSNAAERMNAMYRHQRYFYDITRRHYLLGRTTLINGLCPPDDGSVLEIGCGTGWNLLRAGRAYPGARLFGFDVSTAMLETARRAISRSALGDRIVLAPADATTFNGKAVFGRTSFDRVLASYTFSMIPHWQAALERGLDHLAPDGSFHVVDFSAAAGLPPIVRTGLHGWLEQFDVHPRLTLREELARVAARRNMTLFHTELHRGYAQYAVLSRR